MNIFLVLGILLANTIAIALVYQFVKKLPKKEKIIFIAISFAIIYVLVYIINWISSIGIDERIHMATKDFLIFLFVPVNVILLIPFVAAKYTKYRTKKISKRDLAERIIKVCIVGLVILTLECLYFKNVKQNITILNSNASQKIEEKNKTNTIDINNTTNTTNENIITNKESDSLTNKLNVNGI